MIYVTLGGATLLGIFAGTISATVVYNRLTKRLKRHNSVLQTAIDLELRREKHDSGRETEVRTGAGMPVRISNLAISRPGIMTLSHMAKGVDIAQNSE